MKKFTIVALFVIVFGMVNSSAVVHRITFDWSELGAKMVGVSAPADDYFGEDNSGEKVHNLRCNYSQWDSEQEYFWIISDWANATRQPGWIYLGKQDMTIIESISFDYVSDGANTTGNKVSITKDKEGTEVIAYGMVVEYNGIMSGNPNNVEMEILDNDYNGDIYLYIEYETRFFVGNLVFLTEDDGTTPTPSPEPTPTPEKTATPVKTAAATKTLAKTDSPISISIYAYIAIACIVVIGGVVLFFIWRKKK